MVNEIIKSNSVIVSYSMLSAEGKSQNKRQILNVMPSEASNEDFYEIGRALGDMLMSAPKDILKNSISLLTEV